MVYGPLSGNSYIVNTVNAQAGLMSLVYITDYNIGGLVQIKKLDSGGWISRLFASNGIERLYYGNVTPAGEVAPVFGGSVRFDFYYVLFYN